MRICSTDRMRFGVHLPLMDFGDQSFAVDRLVNYVQTATALGFDAIAANDHILFATPWLDGPTALAAVVFCSGDARLFTTVANPVVRGPAALAKVLAGLDVMSGGRLIAGLGPGSSEWDYANVGVPFDERWVRFDEAVLAIRTLLRGESFTGQFSTVQGPLEPLPVTPGGPPLWIGSWGSDSGLRRVARLGDGWVASAYNTTPQHFRQSWLRVQEHLDRGGRDAQRFGNGLATMWFHLDDHSASDVLESRLAPVLHRPVDQLRDRLAFGPAEAMVAKLSEFQDAGVQRLFIWPVADEIEQLHRFSEEVMGQLGDTPP
jgi:alkanesulfonate monooxygenase SsuD/methylene tetrahydromethanopterin reductase-like flavin-dependent oxidoreductase (luciferase family)